MVNRLASQRVDEGAVTGLRRRVLPGPSTIARELLEFLGISCSGPFLRSVLIGMGAVLLGFANFFLPSRNRSMNLRFLSENIFEKKIKNSMILFIRHSDNS